MKNRIFFGAAPNAVAPIDEFGVDYACLALYINYLINSGVDAVSICGFPIESSVLSLAARQDIIEFSARQIRNRVPLIAGIDCDNPTQSVMLSKSAAESGAHMLSVSLPRNGLSSNDEAVEFYAYLSGTINIPIMLSNDSRQSGLELKPSEYTKLAREKNIAAVLTRNETDYSRLAEFAKQTNLLDFYIGCDEIFIPAMEIGFAGVISSAANIFPFEFKKIITAIKNGDFINARILYGRLIKAPYNYEMILSHIISKFGTDSKFRRLLTEAGYASE